MRKLFFYLTIAIFTSLGCGSNANLGDNQNSQKDSSVKMDKKSESDLTEIDREPPKDNNCYIMKISKISNKNYLTVDYLNIISGIEADEYCKKKGIPVHDKYVIENNEKILKTFLLADNVEITLLDLMDAKPVSGKRLTDLEKMDLTSIVVNITVKDEVITKIVQIFMP